MSVSLCIQSSLFLESELGSILISDLQNILLESKLESLSWYVVTMQ